MKALRICCFAMGTALLLAALFLVLHNIKEDRAGGTQAAEILSALRAEIPDAPEPGQTMPAGEVYDLFAEYDKADAPETVEIGGQRYLGILAVPSLGLELPVMSDWSYPNLKTAPCRYSGSLRTDDLIICAHNYRSHFGELYRLHIGDEILFTDVSGRTHSFAVISTEQLAGGAVGEMQRGAGGDWHLTLYTCTLSGQSRVTIRAERTEAGT